MNKHSDAQFWYPLRLLNLYRLFIAVFLNGFYYSGISESTFGSVSQQLFAYSSGLYFIFSIVLFITQKFRIPKYTTQAHSQIVGDIIFITLIMHASGGISSGLGILFVVSIAGSCILFNGRIGFLFASLATLVLLFVQIYSHLKTGIPTYSYTQTGMLGITLFGTAAIVTVLSARMQEAQALVTQKELDLADLEQLNEHIVQQMQSGIIVVDSNLDIHLINKSAQELLDKPTLKPPIPLKNLSKALLARLNLWVTDQTDKPLKIKQPGSPFEIQPFFTALGEGKNSGTLIILEDTTSYSRELQEAKLTSLGNLTASIAHEIRNPLSAIQHAAQLLEESPKLDTHDHQLTGIINKQTARMNTIIENIMQLSNRDKVIPEKITLQEWLEKFKLDFCTDQNIESHCIEISPYAKTVTIKADPSQLHQVLWNLCTNSLKYGRDLEGKLKIMLSISEQTKDRSIELDICDQGSGIPEDIQDHIFEPFYTISPKSTGLGLFIVRELCELNGLEIRYIPQKLGSCFRIKFSNIKERQAEA